MPRTQAYLEFRMALLMPLELMRQERQHIPDPPPPSQQNIVRGLRGGAAVLMVAAFEAFLDDMAVERIGEVQTYTPPIVFNKLPIALQEQNVFETLERALKGPKYQPAGTRASRIPAIRTASTWVSTDQLNPIAFGDTSGNPGKKAVPDLFKCFGFTDLFNTIRPRFENKWKAPVMPDFLGDKLDEIVQRRHRVAHRADALTISRTDLRESERFLRILAEVLDIELGYHIRAICRKAR